MSEKLPPLSTPSSAAATTTPTRGGASGTTTLTGSGEDYGYEPSSYVATAAAAAKASEASSGGLYRYASVGSLGTGSGGGVVDGILGDGGAYRISAVPTKFAGGGGTLKSSKSGGSSSHGHNSPHRRMGCHGGYCACFGASAGLRRRNSTTASFWPAFLANLGICALLLGYIFIGSFVFLTIEISAGSGEATVAGVADSAAWYNAQVAQDQQQKQHPAGVQPQHEVGTDEARGGQHNHNDNDNIAGSSNSDTHQKPHVSLTALVAEPALDGIATPEALAYTHNTQQQDVAASNAANEDYEVQTMSMDDSEIALEDVERQRTVENIWDITVSLNILYKENWTKLAALEIEKLQVQLVRQYIMDLTLSSEAHSMSTSTSSATYTRGRLAMNANAKQYAEGHKYPPHHHQQRHWQLQQARHWRRQQQQREQFEWNFATAFLYSLTVITTVGYGTITPRTTLGRMVTIGYATLGIPLTLIYLSSVGSILAKLVRVLCTRALCCCLCHRHTCYGTKPSRKCEMKLRQLQQQQQKQQQQQQQQQLQPHLPYYYVRPAAEIGTDTSTTAAHMLGSSFDTLSVATTAESRHSHSHLQAHSGWSLVAPVGVCLLLLLTYVGVGATTLSLLEHWSLLEGVYFCCMTLTTIGFCDLLPGMNRNASAATFAVWFCAVYILSGLTLTSMCVNLLHEEILLRMRVVVKFKKITATQETKERAFYAPP